MSLYHTVLYGLVINQVDSARETCHIVQRGTYEPAPGGVNLLPDNVALRVLIGVPQTMVYANVKPVVGEGQIGVIKPVGHGVVAQEGGRDIEPGPRVQEIGGGRLGRGIGDAQPVLPFLRQAVDINAW